MLTGLFLAVLFLGAMLVDILLNLSVPAGIVGTALIGAAAHEFYVMARGAGAKPSMAWGIFAAVAAFNLPWMAAKWGWSFESCGLLAALALVAFIGIGKRFRTEKPDAVRDVAITLFGAFYVGVLGGYIVRIHSLSAEHGAILVLYFVAVSKTADIGGYLSGKFFGRHKLAPVISPNKTIEGSLGGLALSLIAAFLLAALLPWRLSLPWTIAFAVLVNAASQFGDLAESMLKRGCNVKDSAVILPKVCGALDLIDSILISAPMGFYLMEPLCQA